MTATWRTSGGRWRQGYENLVVGVIGEILPLAVGIAISPVPITLLLFLAVQQERTAGRG